ncbi:hypothetical protein [Marinicella sp. W31]|uniref:hypothetical protein n=1 Tax=Marinicella sp. W31 TaxID=3023713 RepID=UPI003757205A
MKQETQKPTAGKQEKNETDAKKQRKPTRYSQLNKHKNLKNPPTSITIKKNKKTNLMSQYKKTNPWLTLIILIGCFSQAIAASSTDSKGIEGTPNDKEALVYDTDDVALDAEVAEFLAYEPVAQWDDNAYVYLWGMDRQTDDVYQTGLEILRQVKAADQAFNHVDDYDLGFLNKYQTIDLPDAEVFCSFLDAGCFEKTWDNLDALLLPSQDHQTLMTRYLEFFNYDNFSHPKSMTIESPHPTFRSIISAQRLHHIKILGQFKAGKHEEALALLEKQNKDIRKKLSQTNGLIDKMVLNAMLAELIEFANFSYAKKILSAKDVKAAGIFEPLTEQELSVYQPMIMEYNTMMRMLSVLLPQQIKDLDNNPPHWLFESFPDSSKAMIKPNLFLNVQYHQQVKRNLLVHQQNAHDFYQGYDALDIVVAHDLSRNAVGKVFNLTVQENKEVYLFYQVRLYDLDMKIQLLRAIMAEGSVLQLMEVVQKEPTKYPNSYDSSAPYMDDGKVCYSGLDKKNQKYRCLFVLK